MKKTYLVVGLGRFGSAVAQRLYELGSEVMAVDLHPELVQKMESKVTCAAVCDARDEDALRALGVKNFDLCFVCIGSDFASSLLITSMLKDMGAARVVAKASQDIHAKLLLRNGADDVVYPERDSAERMATRLSAQNVFDYIELTDEYSIYEIAPLENWVGHSIREVDVRNKYHINILGVKESGVLKPLPGGDYRFTGNEHLLAMAAREDAKKLLRRI